MSEETILTWNITNWITVVIMAAIGFAILRVGVLLINRQSGAQ